MRHLSSTALLVVLAACGGAPIPELQHDAAGLPDARAGVPDGDVPLPDAAPVPPPCLPRACNSVGRDPAGECVYAPVADGTACEDGDACTADDHCQAGVCGGTPVAQTAATRGRVMGYGAEPVDDWMEGVSAFVADDRVVFLESTKLSSSHLSLVRVDDAGLVRLDEAESALPFVHAINSVVFWGEEPATFVLPMGPERFVVVSSYAFSVRAGLEVWGFHDDALEPRALTPLPALDDPEALTLHGAAAREDALFVCGDISTGRRMRAYTLDDTTSLFTLAVEIQTPPGGCNELALSPDGTRLYVAANGGYRVFDVTDPTKFVVPATGHVVGLVDHFLQDIDVSAEHVVVTTAQPAGELDDAFVFTIDGTPLGAVPPPAESNGTPFGLALAGSRLYVEWSTPAGRYLAAVHDLAAAGMPVLGSRVFHEGGAPDTQITPAARGDLVLLQPWRRVLAGDALAERTGPGHGSMRTLVATAPAELRALGPISTQRLDVSDANAPSLIAGGSYLPISREDHEILRAPDGAFQLVSPRPSAFAPLEQTRTRERFALLDATPARVGAGYVDGPHSGAGFGFGHAQLFQVIPAGANLRVRRFSAPSLAGLTGQPWPADLEATVPGVALPEFTRVRVMAVGVSPSGDDVLVVTSRSTQETVSRFRFALSWLRITPGGVTVLAEGDFATTGFPFAIDVAFVGDAAIVLGNNRIARVARNGGRIMLELTRTPSVDSLYQRILAADARRVLVTRHGWIGAGTARKQVWTVDHIGVSDLVTALGYDTPDEVQSVLTAGTRLYFGMNAGLVAATPECP